ncbi:MAG: cystathionine beta-lyase, partial [Promethearchaeota archaeon]
MSKYHYNFDEIIDRTNTYSEKWDEVDKIFLNSNLLPLWVADMDFLSPQPIIDAFIKRAKHGIYGYTFLPPEYYDAIIN